MKNILVIFTLLGALSSYGQVKSKYTPRKERAFSIPESENVYGFMVYGKKTMFFDTLTKIWTGPTGDDFSKSNDIQIGYQIHYPETEFTAAYDVLETNIGRITLGPKIDSQRSDKGGEGSHTTTVWHNKRGDSLWFLRGYDNPRIFDMWIVKDDLGNGIIRVITYAIYKCDAGIYLHNKLKDEWKFMY